MRRSLAPSTKRQRTDDAENIQPYCISSLSQQTCSKGITLGGFLGLSNISGASVGIENADKATQSRQDLVLKPHRTAPTANGIVKQFKCPLPNNATRASSAVPRGTLGIKKQYGPTFDIMAAIQRKVYVSSDEQHTVEASSVGSAKQLILYDPEEHRMQLLEQQQQALQDTGATGPAGATAIASAAPSTAAATCTAVGADSTSTAPAAAVAPGEAVPGSDQQDPAPKLPNIAFGISWDNRVKVYADAFLVEKLRPHQREGVKFVFECLAGVKQDGVYGAVLADDMGLGKTFQTIASLYSLLTKGVAGQPTCKKPLILCPTSLVQHWGKELKLWLGDRVVPVVVDDTRADHVKKSFQDFRAFSNGGKPKVLVMSYPCFRMHKTEVYKMGMDVVMCDEAHFLKNGEAQITQAVAGLTTATRRLLMSGTPIQNDLSEFHAVFDLACPGLLGDLKTFNKLYEGPIQRGRNADATEKQVALGLERMEQLMKLCHKFMLRRTSTVLKALLPAKVEQVVFCRLSSLQLKLYNAFLASKPVQTLLASTATDPESRAAAAAAAKAKRQSLKASKKASTAAAAVTAATPDLPVATPSALAPPPALLAPPTAAADTASAVVNGTDEFCTDLRSTTIRRATSTSAAASLPLSRTSSSSCHRRQSAPAATHTITTNTRPSQHHSEQQQQQGDVQQQQGNMQQQQGSTQQQPDRPKDDLLAPLAAITALKKLCCHPDLTWEMLNKHKVQAVKQAQQQQLMAMLQAQKRVSARAVAVRSYAEDDAAEEQGEEKATKAVSGSGRRKSSSAAKSGSARQQLTGFEGCESLFDGSDVYPKYLPGKCQAYHSGKVVVLEALLKAIRESEPTDKVVLVSNYTEALDVLGVMCASHSWQSLRLDGSCSVQQRQSLVDTFNDPQHPSFVLLLSSKAGGVGLNIIGANRLVLFDPGVHKQLPELLNNIISRSVQQLEYSSMHVGTPSSMVWREGQKKRVWVYRLLIAGSIEEKVLQRQLAKQGLSEALVDEVGQQVRTFSRDELRSLFRVDPTTPCDTHSAIKCSCKGTVADMETCRKRCAAAVAQGPREEGDGGLSTSTSTSSTEQQGVMAWAHLARAADSPDPTWQVVKDFVRDKFVTYVFSDHVLDDHGAPPAAAVTDSSSKAGKKRRRAAGDYEAGDKGSYSTDGSSSSSSGDEVNSEESSDAEDSSDGQGDSDVQIEQKMQTMASTHKQQQQRCIAASRAAVAASKPYLPTRLAVGGAAAPAQTAVTATALTTAASGSGRPPLSGAGRGRSSMQQHAAASGRSARPLLQQQGQRQQPVQQMEAAGGPAKFRSGVGVGMSAAPPDVTAVPRGASTAAAPAVGEVGDDPDEEELQLALHASMGGGDDDADWFT